MGPRSPLARARIANFAPAHANLPRSIANRVARVSVAAFCAGDYPALVGDSPREVTLDLRIESLPQ
jgi:hypothetical protein